MIDADHAKHALLQQRSSSARQKRRRAARLAAASATASRTIEDRERNFGAARCHQRMPDAKVRARPSRKAITAGALRPAAMISWSSTDRRRPGTPPSRKLLDPADGLRRDAAGQSRHQRVHGRHRSRPSAARSASWSASSSANCILRPSDRQREQTICLSAAQIPRVEPPQRACPDLAGRTAARRARYRADREFHDRHGVSGTPGRPAALSDIGQWRSAGTLLDRTDDRTDCSARPISSMPTASRWSPVSRFEVVDAVAGARRDHRPVRRRRPQGRRRRADILHVRRQ